MYFAQVDINVFIADTVSQRYISDSCHGQPHLEPSIVSQIDVVVKLFPVRGIFVFAPYWPPESPDVNPVENLLGCGRTGVWHECAAEKSVEMMSCNHVNIDPFSEERVFQHFVESRP